MSEESCLLYTSRKEGQEIDLEEYKEELRSEVGK